MVFTYFWIRRISLPAVTFTSSHHSFSNSYKPKSCRDFLFLCTKTFCLVSVLLFFPSISIITHTVVGQKEGSQLFLRFAHPDISLKNISIIVCLLTLELSGKICLILFALLLLSPHCIYNLPAIIDSLTCFFFS